MKEEKIYIGLDLGTNSCGWAVTDDEYSLIRRKGKSLWGVRKFEEAKTADERRMKRSSRRRIDRRQWRIDLLQELFAPEISKVDSEFFLRLNNSFYQEDDKKTLGRFSLFNDQSFTDKQYYKQYPTIFHLRQALKSPMHTKDLRLVYLACHHIIKYRGHFLLDGMEFESGEGGFRYLRDMFSELIALLNESTQDESVHYDFCLVDEVLIQMIACIKREHSAKRLFEAINSLVNQKGSKPESLIVKAICGLSVKPSDLFDSDEYDDLEMRSIQFSDPKFTEEYEPRLHDWFGDRADLIFGLKRIHDWMVLRKILGNKDELSLAMIDLYEKHKADLKLLKSLFRKYLTKKDYVSMFRSVSKDRNNYCRYVKTNQVGNRKMYVPGCSQEDFFGYVKTCLKNMPQEDPSVVGILREIEDGTFLPKQTSKLNSIFPYQVHQKELDKILHAAEAVHPFLNQPDSDGLTISDKVSSLMTFRIPYHVGPLNRYHSDHGKGGHAWIVRKEQGRIVPWNFEQKIDIDASAQEFVLRMTNKCTYMRGKDVLPKNSLIYSEFALLNELNNIRLHSRPLNMEIRHKIWTELFETSKSVTQKRFRQYLIRSGLLDKHDENAISGMDGDFKNPLVSHVDMTQIFGSVNHQNKPMLERIIFLLTVFEDRNMAIRQIRREFNLSDTIIQKLRRLNYTGWGRLSHEFLGKELYAFDELGEVVTILSLMRKNGLNLMQALYDPKYGFMERVDEWNHGSDSVDFTYDTLVAPLYAPTATKRSIWQALQIVKELEHIIQKPIDRFFVEVTRAEGEKKRTISRRRQIDELYKASKLQKDQLNEMINQLRSYPSDAAFKSDKLYLYFTQLGKCMYTGEPIQLDSLFSNDYDIDHIIPRSILKDDSLSNRVLVKNQANKDKADMYPLSPAVQERMRSHWQLLLIKGLIPKDKFDRLVRTMELTDDEIGSFINRQLVFTNQSVKALCDVLKTLYPKAEIVYSKAGNVSDFRQEFDLLKCREVNDFHHAHDAYLNIVVGNAYYQTFGYDARKTVRALKDANRTTNTKRLFQGNIPYAWRSNGTSIAKVKQVLFKNNPLVTFMPFEAKGKFYDETVYPKSADLIPVTEDSTDPRIDSSKYGGYSSMKNAYFFLVESDGKKGTRKLTLETVPILYAERIRHGKMSLNEFVSTIIELSNPAIIVPCIKMKSMIQFNKSRVLIAGAEPRQVILHNANQMFADFNLYSYVRLIAKYMDLEKMDNSFVVTNDAILISESKEKGKPDKIISRNENMVLYKKLISQLGKPQYSKMQSGKYADKLRLSMESFESLDISNQTRFLYRLLKLIQTGDNQTDLSIMFDKANFVGKTRISRNVTDIAFAILDQSITGFYETVRWWNKNVIPNRGDQQSL